MPAAIAASVTGCVSRARKTHLPRQIGKTRRRRGTDFQSPQRPRAVEIQDRTQGGLRHPEGAPVRSPADRAFLKKASNGLFIQDSRIIAALGNAGGVPDRFQMKPIATARSPENRKPALGVRGG